MSYFASEAEVHEYIGGIFRDAADHPEIGPKLAAAGIALRIVYSDPDTEFTVRFSEPRVEVTDAPPESGADVTLEMPADIADRYWRGEYNLAVGLARGQVKAKGPVNKILKLVPLTKPLFPLYKEKVAAKDAS